MFLESLEIVNFKNHSNLQLDFKEKLNVFIGKNGVGKTNILDAIYYLSVFRSHIHNQDIQNIKKEESFFRLKGFYSPDYQVLVKYAYRNKSIEINKIKLNKYSEYFGHIPLVHSSPSDIFLLYGGSEERRKFIDFTISTFDSDYLKKLTEYNKYLEQRNGHLKNSELIDLDLIKYYNSHLINLGELIFETRKEVLTKLSDRIQYWYQQIAKSDDSIVTNYYSQLLDGNIGTLLKQNFEKDKILKRSTVGIHKDDLKIEMRDVDLKKIASQGQQKSILYALRLAQAELISTETNSKIIFLLDDFSDKLDIDRRGHLLDRIQTVDFVSQWFLTDTIEDNFKSTNNCQIFKSCFESE